MGKPVLSGNSNSFFVSAAQVLFNNVDVGFASGVNIKIKHETTEVKTDQLGKTVANHFHVGDTITVEMMIDELTAARLKEAYPFAKLMTTGPAARISWGQAIGGSFYSLAQTLVIKPTGDDTSFTLRNFKFYKAAPIGDSEVKYSPEGKTQIKVVFHCYPDLTQADGELFGYFGDISAGAIVHAAAGAAVPGVNTGDGTVSAIVVNDDFTKTETWTLTCIAAAVNGGLFSVVGSVTGARGVATVGSSYFSNSITPANSEIQFLVNDGAVDFIVGDTFTIATTAKTYV